MTSQPSPLWSAGEPLSCPWPLCFSHLPSLQIYYTGLMFQMLLYEFKIIRHTSLLKAFRASWLALLLYSMLLCQSLSSLPPSLVLSWWWTPIVPLAFRPQTFPFPWSALVLTGEHAHRPPPQVKQLSSPVLGTMQCSSLRPLYNHVTFPAR